MHGLVSAAGFVHFATSKISHLSIFCMNANQPAKGSRLFHAAYKIAIGNLRIIRVGEGHEALVCNATQLVQSFHLFYAIRRKPAPESKINAAVFLSHIQF